MILLLGKIPPPIGGVSIHITRLMGSLDKRVDIENWDYSKEKNITKIVSKIIKADVVHIHLTKKFYRLLVVLLFKLFLKKVIITFHGKYNFENFTDQWALKLCDSAILLNKFSYKRAAEIRKKNNHLIGSFIPPVPELIIPLPLKYELQIRDLKLYHKKVFAMNASSYALDPNGQEIYMGTKIIKLFAKNPDIALIFSDPSNSYLNFFESSGISIPSNVLFINQSHDFVSVVQQVDGIIRATTMDGDSLTIKEALFYNKPVFATDVVDRPTGTITFRDFDQLEELLNNRLEKTKFPVDNSLHQIITVYQSMKKKNDWLSKKITMNSHNSQ